MSDAKDRYALLTELANIVFEHELDYELVTGTDRSNGQTFPQYQTYHGDGDAATPGSHAIIEVDDEENATYTIPESTGTAFSYNTETGEEETEEITTRAFHFKVIENASERASQALSKHHIAHSWFNPRYPPEGFFTIEGITIQITGLERGDVIKLPGRDTPLEIQVVYGPGDPPGDWPLPADENGHRKGTDPILIYATGGGLTYGITYPPTPSSDDRSNMTLYGTRDDKAAVMEQQSHHTIGTESLPVITDPRTDNRVNSPLFESVAQNDAETEANTMKFESSLEDSPIEGLLEDEYNRE
jgi:hypothetical protein